MLDTLRRLLVLRIVKPRYLWHALAFMALAAASLPDDLPFWRVALVILGVYGATLSLAKVEDKFR